jgi:replication factor A1
MLDDKLKVYKYGGLIMTGATVKINEIGKAGEWISTMAKVIQLWESSSPSIFQVGLIGDETGIVKFVSWTKANIPELVKGETYTFENVVTQEYQGNFSVSLNSKSRVMEV